ncbi:MAG: hypothetical protein CM15mP120_15880 [Pseudomonadota bacterium]|nr:MAG: hypothetical protein CM15mP120_15880 [Pseudomonadota bacterium]
MNKVLLIGLAVVVLGAAGYGVLTNTRAGQDFCSSRRFKPSWERLQTPETSRA